VRGLSPLPCTLPALVSIKKYHTPFCTFTHISVREVSILFHVARYYWRLNKGKVFSVHGVKVHMEWRLNPLILNRDSRWKWVVNLMTLPISFGERPTSNHGGGYRLGSRCDLGFYKHKNSLARPGISHHSLRRSLVITPTSLFYLILVLFYVDALLLSFIWNLWRKIIFEGYLYCALLPSTPKQHLRLHSNCQLGWNQNTTLCTGKCRRSTVVNDNRFTSHSCF
jgi:hypothetical protein